MVERYSSLNDYIVLTGDRNHGEVIGIAGYAGKNFSQLQNYEEAEKFTIDDPDSKNVILLSQTTYSPLEFEKIQNLFTKNMLLCSHYSEVTVLQMKVFKLFFKAEH